ncbi:MAG: type II secretion system protein [Campylobacter sp.]|nr:type II secretion system protein [Campylobacter sp.]
MKKAFTMIELIFVIVILGILASVAIPRLAATREDAEISTAVANLRTLVSDAAAYYAVKDGFGTGDTGAKWSEFTNVPLNNPNGTANGSDGVIKIGGKECIRVQVKDRSDNVPAHILVAKDGTNKNSGACKQVVVAEPIKAYFDSRVAGVEGLGADKGAIPIGSSTSIYVASATASATRPATAAKPAAQQPAAQQPAKPTPAKPTPPKPTPPKPAANPFPFACANCDQAYGIMNSFSAAAKTK